MTDRAEIEAIAAQWLMRRDEDEWTPDEERDFQSWLHESVAHQAAFWRLEVAWQSADRLAALAPGAGMPFHAHWRSSRIVQATVASLALLCCLTIAVYQYMSKAPASLAVQELRFATPVGGKKDIALSDGSHVMLNTATVVRVSLGRGYRKVWLERGEAFFDIVHDRTSPFSVYAGSDRVTVLGTRFSVRHDPGKMRVAVEKGAVEIKRMGRSGGPPDTIVHAGQTATVQDKSVLLTSGVEDALSWLRGTLTFSNTTVEQAANEFNRYNLRQIRLEDDAARQTRIGGSFRPDNVDAFVRLLHEVFGMRVTQAHNEIIISS